jgi:hypothetical protein
MKQKRKKVLTSIVALYTIISMIGCSIAWEHLPNGEFSTEDYIEPVAQAVEQQWDVVKEVFKENEVITQRMRSIGESIDGKQVISSMLEEEGGPQYLKFSHALVTGEDSTELLAHAKELISDEDYQQLEENIDQTTAKIRSFGESEIRALPPSQRAPFMRDLQKLVTKTIVLLVAGIVYAAIPDMVFWGKVTAAAAVSVAAGVVATTILALYRYYETDESSLTQSFEQWIVDVTTDPSAAYAMAKSIITVGKTMKNGAVVTGLILVVFAIYQVLDMVKPMLKQYNFNA